MRGRPEGATLGLFVGFSALYWLGRSTTFGPGDSPQHVLSAITWGVSWPPGYPLYVLLGHLMSKLPGSAAGNVNWLSGLLHAATYSLFYSTLRRCRIAVLPSLIASVALGLSPLFWYYSLNAEARPLNDLLSVAAAYFAIGWAQERRLLDLAGLALSIGLGIGHHPTYLLILPALGLLIWDTLSVGTLGFATLLACAGLVVPYVALGLRIVYGHPSYDLIGAERFRDVVDLFLRRDLGGPLRVVAGQGLLGPEGFDMRKLLTHLRWFASALTTSSSLVVFPLAALGFAVCLRSDKRRALFWSAWFLVSAFTFVVLGSQQLRLHDPDFAYSVAVRFYLLPMIALYAFVAYGADAIGGRWRAPAHLAILAFVVLVPLVLSPVTLNGKDIVYRYAEEMITETDSSDMIVLDTDASFFALDYLDLVEGRLDDRVLLMPSLFSFPPYRVWLNRRYPLLHLPPAELMMDWTRWRALNPDRRLYAEVEWRDSIGDMFPGSAPAGVLLQACKTGESCAQPQPAARRLAAITSLYTFKDLYPFSLDVYVLKHEMEMVRWLSSLGTSPR